MIKGENIVCVGFPTWEGDYMKSTVELMSVFAKENKVLYIDYEFTFKDVLMGIIGKKEVPVKRILGLTNRLRKLPAKKGGSIYVLTPPPVFPTNFIKSSKYYDRVLRIAANSVKRSIKKAMKQLDITKPIVINAFNPFFGNDLAGKLNEEQLLYYCYDEIGAAAWSKNHGVRLEEKFIKKVDGVITSSIGLHNARKPLNKSSFLVKNGVDFDLFNTAFKYKNKSKLIPKESYSKVVGYIGSIDFRLDYELLEHLFTQMPTTLFAFVGRVNFPKGEAILNKHDNVVLLGPHPPNYLPKFLGEFDLGIIPFEKNEFTKGIYPLKINEYLSAGIPVVLTSFSDLSDFESSTKIVNNKASFLEAVHYELENDSLTQQIERAKVGFNNSWENRVDQISDIILKIRENKK
tara:strand:+ start:13353 stop:14564 length:1212 start_codon:yes stop_codon:yes gene_type:complete